MKKFIKIFATLSIAVIICFSATGCQFIKLNGNGFYQNNSSEAMQHVQFATTLSEQREKLSLVDAIAKVERSSVMIQTDGSLGSGIMVDVSVAENKYLSNDDFVFILTCHHVIASARNVKVCLPDENFDFYNENFAFTGAIGSDISPSSYAVSLVGGDKLSDVAVLKLDLSKTNLSASQKANITKAKIAPLDQNVYSMRRGEEVFSIGNPTGELPGSCNSGIISYLDRVTHITDVGEMSLIQHDVAIQHGSSGGGLFNLYGELIGITNAGSDTYKGMNYAIPYNSNVKEGQENRSFVVMAKQLLGTATSTNYGYISQRKDIFGFTVTTQSNSVIITDITANSQAQQVGLQINDHIVAISTDNSNYITLTNNSQLSSVINSLKVGDFLYLQIRKPYDYASEDVKVIKLEVKLWWFCNTASYEDGANA